MIIPLADGNIILDSRAKGQWCLLPYPRHPQGCPNFNKKKSCPPFSKPFEDLIAPPFLLVIQPFDIDAQAKRMKTIHPNWTDRQARCLLYWQKSERKRLKEEARKFTKSQENDCLLLESPEANGVDIFATCSKVGIILENNPKKTIWKVMIIGKKIPQTGYLKATNTENVELK
jgi:hypothetical protein